MRSMPVEIVGSQPKWPFTWGEADERGTRAAKLIPSTRRSTSRKQLHIIASFSTHRYLNGDWPVVDNFVNLQTANVAPICFFHDLNDCHAEPVVP
jgi:hypothetical protein